MFGLGSRADPTSDRPAEQRKGGLELEDPAFGDLGRLDDDRVQDDVVEDAAVEEETHATGAVRPGVQKVHAHEPAGGDVDAALLFGFATTGLHGDSPISITPPGIVQPPL